MKPFLKFSPTLILALAISACSGFSSVPTPENTLFFDDFSQSPTSWSQIQNASGSASQSNGGFHFEITPKDTLMISNPGKSFPGDVSVEVDVRSSAGSVISYMGVVCHYQDANNYYMFLITTDGSAGIIMDYQGLVTMISPGLKFLPMDGIKKWNATNHIRATCIGETLTLYANGTQVSLAYDSTLTGGDVGLVARSGKYQGGTNLTFRNFLVTQP